MVRDIIYGHEVLRKLGHVLVGVTSLSAGFVVHKLFGMEAVSALLFIAVLFSFFADYLRLELNVRWRELRFLERQREMHTLHATTFTLLGALLALEFFDPVIAVTSISMFFFGDAAAAIVGRTVQGPKLFGNKTWSGSSAMLLVSAACAFLLLDSLLLIIAMALTATLVELIVEKIDDSFAIIVFAGFVGQVVSLL